MSADKEIIVVGTGIDSSRVQVTYRTKDEDGNWKQVFSVPGFCGFHGMAAEEKREGDRRTPIGTWGFVCAFGILPDPGSVLPYKELDEDDYWVDDGNSEFYNQMVSTNTTARTWASAEHLIEMDPAYRYGLAMDYNVREQVRGKGSAIFLHGINPPHEYTEGCIAISEEYVRLLVQQVDEYTKIVIVPE